MSVPEKLWGCCGSVKRNERLTSIMRQVHNVCDEYGDVATTSLLEVWIDETERRTWFLFEATRGGAGAND